MKQNKIAVVTLLPLVVAIFAAHFEIIMLFPIVGIMAFVLVAILPFAHKHESLWLFLICTISFLPLNLFLVEKYPVLQEWLCIDTNIRILFLVSTIEALAILTGVEEVIIGFLGRLIWRKQYRLNIPELSED